MPTYEYRCATCGNTFEQEQKITADPLKLCPRCGHESLHRGPGGGLGLRFEGSGFYITDYAKGKPQVESPDPRKAPCCPCGKSEGSCQKKPDA